MKYLPLILLFSCSIPREPDIVILKKQVKENKAELLRLQCEIDSALFLNEILDSNLTQMERAQLWKK